MQFPPATRLAVLCDGTRDHVEALREEISGVLATMGLAFSEAKTRVVHMSEGLDFLGFRIQWKRKRGTNTWRDCSGGCRDPDVSAGEFGEHVEGSAAVFGRGR